MARVRTGRPTGRPPSRLQERAAVVDMHLHIPLDLVEKIDRLRKGDETRKDIIIRAIEELKEGQA